MNEPQEKDPQTGLFTRHAVLVELQRRFAAALRARPRGPRTLAVVHPPGPYLILAMLEAWKRFLDVAGLTQGETLLRELGAGIAALLPPRAIAGRLDGQSVLILLDDADGAQARQLAERILALPAPSMAEARLTLVGTAFGNEISAGGWRSRGCSRR